MYKWCVIIYWTDRNIVFLLILLCSVVLRFSHVHLHILLYTEYAFSFKRVLRVRFCDEEPASPTIARSFAVRLEFHRLSTTS